MKKIGLFLCLIFFTGCVPTQELPVLPSDADIQKLDSDQLCALKTTLIDPRLDAAIKKKGADCDPSSKYCQEQGLKKGSEKFSNCSARYKAAIELENKKLENPAFGYCYNNGFKAGTHAMATCMSSWNEREQTERIIQLQQEHYERSRKDQAWKDLSESFRQDAIRQRQNMPKSTTCNTYGSTTNCTTW